jgi:ribosomal protein S18 acetylase RimI-like enzyme
MVYSVLKKDYLLEHIDQFIALNRQSVDPRMYWEKENFNYDAEGKWDLSLVGIFDKTMWGYLIGSKKSNEIAHINLLMVDKEHRAKKIGKSLVAAFINRCKTQGFKVCTLSVYDDLTVVKSFYESLGFAKEEERLNDKAEKLSMFALKL